MTGRVFDMVPSWCLYEHIASYPKGQWHRGDRVRRLRGMTEAADPPSLARALHELEAAKARVERDACLVAQETRTKLVAELLPVMDNLDRTIDAADSSGEAAAILEGARLVRSQLEAVLRGYGVERVDATSQRFDAAVHDAVGVIPVRDRGFHDIVIHQLQPCYRFGSALLRPAKVVVGKCQL
jgi:molecular chaperone GrpE